jgi:hypothetical protein
VVAPLHFGLHDGDRAWTTFDRDAMDRLYARGLISNRPAGRVGRLTDEAFASRSDCPGSCSARDVSIPAGSFIDGADLRFVNLGLTESRMVDQARPPPKEKPGRSAGTGKGGLRNDRVAYPSHGRTGTARFDPDRATQN